MATTEVALHSVPGRVSARPTARSGALYCAGLTTLALAVHGYHPYVEDGGLYLAGIKRLLNPRLYPYWTGFVTTHLKFSLFAPMVAGAVHLSHLSLMMVMLVLYIGSMWLTLFSGWLLTCRCALTRNQCMGAVTLLALMLTIPVAGTSLMLMDPYVTARSLSTPCGMLMLVGALDALIAWSENNQVAWKAMALLAGSFAFAAVMHPLMAAYSLSFVLLLVCLWIPDKRARMAATLGLSLLGVAVAGCMEWLGPANTAAYSLVARTRNYWFLSQWQWYEVLGLVGPLAILAAIARANGMRRENPAARRLAAMAAIVGLASILAALLFARVDERSYEFARLQPLRTYQTIYLLMLLALGAFLSDRVLKKSLMRWGSLVVLAGSGMALVQKQTFPASGHIEWPGHAAQNPWEQAFDWIRTNTPKNSAFALDANYIRAADEDSQNFKAIAERSAVPDDAKDGGIASIAPALTEQWIQGRAAQLGLDSGVSMADVTRLRALSVTWIVVRRETTTAFSCSYENGAVKVCPLPQLGSLPGYGREPDSPAARPVAPRPR